MTTRQEIIDYCLSLPATYEDYPFDEVIDENACTVMRHRQNKKSFALIMRHGGELYLNLKCDPLEADFLRSVYKNVIPGWHMNKLHWNTVVMSDDCDCTNGYVCDVPADEIIQMIENSYDLIKPKERKRKNAD